MPHIIVVGNEKGGSGKTTTAMHLIMSLLYLGFEVGSLDLDSRQKSLTQYIENRKKMSKESRESLLLPEHYYINRSANKDRVEAEKDEEYIFLDHLKKLASKDFIVIDTPGSDIFLSRLAHSHANTIITPINDSFVDLDLIGKINLKTLDVEEPGVYSSMVWEQKIKKAATKQAEINWFLVRNRLSALDARNKRNMAQALRKIEKRFGCKVIPGFGDRVVFKELFLNGLTLHDANIVDNIKITPSVIAAKQELRNFVRALEIGEIIKVFDEPKQGTEQSPEQSPEQNPGLDQGKKIS